MGTEKIDRIANYAIELGQARIAGFAMVKALFALIVGFAKGVDGCHQTSRSPNRLQTEFI